MSRPQRCARCGEEVRYGRRGDLTGYLHRDDADHFAAFGVVLTPEVWDGAMAAIRTRLTERKGTKSDEDDDTEAEQWDTVPEPEIRAVEVDPDSFPDRSGIKQIINLLVKTPGWEITSISHARGPYVGARGQVLSISDHHKVSALGAEVDSGRRFVVASWRDLKFDAGYIGVTKDRVVHPNAANSTALKAWIKETP